MSWLGFFLLGLLIGRWWALVVTGAYGVIHAIPVYLGLMPGHPLTWGKRFGAPAPWPSCSP